MSCLNREAGTRPHYDINSLKSQKRSSRLPLLSKADMHEMRAPRPAKTSIAAYSVMASRLLFRVLQ